MNFVSKVFYCCPKCRKASRKDRGRGRLFGQWGRWRYGSGLVLGLKRPGGHKGRGPRGEGDGSVLFVLEGFGWRFGIGRRDVGASSRGGVKMIFGTGIWAEIG